MSVTSTRSRSHASLWKHSLKLQTLLSCRPTDSGDHEDIAFALSQAEASSKDAGECARLRHAERDEFSYQPIEESASLSGEDLRIEVMGGQVCGHLPCLQNL